MATQPIEQTGYEYSQLQSQKTHRDAGFSLETDQSKSRQPDVSDGCVACDTLASIVREVERANDGALSFNHLAAHRDELEAKWDREVRSDLFSIGVDLTTPFRLVHDAASDSVTASSDHPDTLRIDQYFMGNQQKALDFKKRLTLDKLVDVAQRTLSTEEMDTPMDEESMVGWFRSHMDTASLFSGGGIIFGRGRSAYRGLDLRV